MGAGSAALYLEAPGQQKLPQQWPTSADPHLLQRPVQVAAAAVGGAEGGAVAVDVQLAH